MHFVNRAEFARICGVSRSAVTQAIAGHLLDLTAEKLIDVDAATSVLYAERSAERLRSRNKPAPPWANGDHGQSPATPGARKKKRTPTAPKPTPKPPKKAEPKPKPPAKANPDQPIETTPAENPQTCSDESEEAKASAEAAKQVFDTEMEKRKADLALKRAKIEQERMKSAQARRELISAKMVAFAFGRLGAVLEEHFRSFGERNASTIVAAMESGKREGAIADLLDSEIGRGVAAFKRAAIHEIAELHLENQ